MTWMIHCFTRAVSDESMGASTKMSMSLSSRVNFGMVFFGRSEISVVDH